MTLAAFFREYPKVALALSGGVDSAYLLYEALRLGADVQAYFVKTAFQPAFELADAKKLAASLNAALTVVECDVLAAEHVAENPENRCYFCKRALFSALWETARRDGYPCIIDGTNASDAAAERPGMQALEELQVRSPLRECGVTKQTVRRLAHEAGLFVWDKPAYACLATRVAAGEPVTAALLERVERAEDALFRLGFTDFRVRVFHEAARVQLHREQMERAVSRREQILAALRPWFSVILLDLDGRN